MPIDNHSNLGTINKLMHQQINNYDHQANQNQQYF